MPSEESEENYRKEQEQARVREEQLRSTRQTSRSDINLYPTLANSTPIRNTNTRSDQLGVHFNINAVHHVLHNYIRQRRTVRATRK